MLTQLTITNFAIIDQIDLVFKDNFIVLTGETGAGKSIIADAIDFLFGSRTNSDQIKTGTNKAIVEAVHELPLHESPLQKWLEKNGFENPEDKNILTVSRELTPQGSKARINGSLANVSHLLFLRRYIIDIHEQSEHIELLKLEKQLEILDSHGDGSHEKLISEYKKSFEEYQLIKSRLNNHLQGSAELTKKQNLLEFEVEEIKSAQINDTNEEENLIAKREILLNKKDLIENTSLIYEIVNGENQNNLIFSLSQIKKLLTNSLEFDKSFEPYLVTIENIISEVKELSSFVNSYSENIDCNESDLDEIEDRLDLFYDLKRKYGKTLADILEHYKKIQIELKELKSINISQDDLEKSFEQKEKEINILAEKLTRSREKITEDFVNKVNEELQTLGFKHALFVIEFTECELSQNGKEQIQFLFTANPDEPPKPLLKVASGGELSRIMLAIKSTLCMGLINQTPATMIFDEIDMGVSGEIASSVSKKLYKISKQNQIICITHQPIICAMADSHFVIEKNITNETTHVTVKEISQNEKAEALATLLTPDKNRKDGITEDAKLFARSLLENARKVKERGFITV